MFAVLTLLFILTLSILITRIATVALTHTGLSHESARFQARSAFTGVGFTTHEAERVVAHPVRRRIIMLLMLLGNVGLASVLATLVISFAGAQGGWTWTQRLFLLSAGLVALWGVSKSPWVDRWLSIVIDRALKRWTDLDVRDYARLLKLSGDYSVMELQVRADDWVANTSLVRLRLRDEGIVLLGIDRSDGSYLGVPRGDTVIEPGDTLILYGHEDALRQLDLRTKGTGGLAGHLRAVEGNLALRERERREQESRRRDADAPPSPEA
jgi:hypothetical protein